MRAWRYVESIELERKARVDKDTEWTNELIRAGYLKPRKPYRPHWFEYNGDYHTHYHYKVSAHHRDLRNAADPDHALFICPARNQQNLLSAKWFDATSRNSCGWKNSTKCRHQWEPNVIKKASKTKVQGLIYFIKNFCYYVYRK